jgi:hypothetical protein
VQLAVEIVGGQALSRKHPLERMLRDVQCHRFNPPQADAVMTGLARDTTAAWRLSEKDAPRTPDSISRPANETLATPA